MLNEAQEELMEEDTTSPASSPDSELAEIDR